MGQTRWDDVVRGRQRARLVHALQDSPEPLWRGYDIAVLDLDGVVYRGAAAVPPAPELLSALRARGLRLAFVTNNAPRTPAEVAAQLRRLGVPAAAGDVVTSAQAAARLVAARVAPGGRILVVGGDGLRQAVAEYGLAEVDAAAERPDAVVQGFGPQVGWQQLAEAAYAVATGVPWVATNLDQTVPTEWGVAPGNGTLVAAVVAATGRGPVVAGKPEPALFDETVLRVGGSSPLVVGDRLDTDIAGANRVGVDSLLVLTGVTDLDRLAAAEASERPTYVSLDLAGLMLPHTLVSRDGESVVCGRWAARVAAGEVRVDPMRAADIEPDHDRNDLVRAAVSAAWRHRYDNGAAPTMRPVSARLRGMMTETQNGEATT